MTGEDDGPRTIRYVTRTGLFAELIAPDPAWIERARERLAEMTDEEKQAAVARYLRARYGRAGTAT